MTTHEETAERPSLRITELAITNYRSFRARTVLPFGDGASGPDPIVTLHGDNGAGKSNALAALDLFFSVLTLGLRAGDAPGELLLAWDTATAFVDREITLFSRDRPVGADGPTDIEVRFQDPRLGALRVRCIPSGKRVRLRAEHRPAGGSVAADFKLVPAEDRDRLLTWLETPLGPQSRAFAIVDERRRPRWLPPTEQGSLLHPELARRLFAVRTGYDPRARQSWRAFGKILQRFPQFKNKLIDIQPGEAGWPEIVVEEPGKTVLRLDELSSGEQQLLVLYASVLFARAPIVAIAEPELSLDEKNRKAFADLLAELVAGGRVDQILVESHVPAFDGERVLRFRRSATGSTEVERVRSLGPEELEIRTRATEQGAQQRWVTRDGYTQLPDAMCEDLGVKNGANVWFLKNHDRWGAWPESELEELFKQSLAWLEALPDAPATPAST